MKQTHQLQTYGAVQVRTFILGRKISAWVSGITSSYRLTAKMPLRKLVRRSLLIAILSGIQEKACFRWIHIFTCHLPLFSRNWRFVLQAIGSLPRTANMGNKYVIITPSTAYRHFRWSVKNLISCRPSKAVWGAWMDRATKTQLKASTGLNQECERHRPQNICASVSSGWDCENKSRLYLSHWRRRLFMFSINILPSVKWSFSKNGLQEWSFSKKCL